MSQVATQVQIQTFVLCWCDFIEISLKIERAHHQRNVNRVYNQFLIRFQGRLNPFSDFPFLVIIIIFYRVFLASFFAFFIVCLFAYVDLRNFLSIFLRFYYDFSSTSIVLQFSHQVIQKKKQEWMVDVSISYKIVALLIPLTDQVHAFKHGALSQAQFRHFNYSSLFIFAAALSLAFLRFFMSFFLVFLVTTFFAMLRFLSMLSFFFFLLMPSCKYNNN